jgi:hypothetical protein
LSTRFKSLLFPLSLKSLHRERQEAGGRRQEVGIDLLHKSEKLTISNFGFWILDFGLRDLGLLQEVLFLDKSFRLLVSNAYL